MVECTFWKQIFQIRQGLQNGICMVWLMAVNRVHVGIHLLWISIWSSDEDQSTDCEFASLYESILWDS
jgi:hypothetical protein